MTSAAGTSTDIQPSPAPLRRALLVLFLLGVIGCAAELLLLKHFEDGWQLVPLILFAVSLVALACNGLRPSISGIRLIRLIMLLFLISGVIGIFLHYQAKAVFAREMHPELSGIDLMREAMKGQMPPVLAPGMMIHLGLLGLAWTWRHPATINAHRITQPEG